MTRFLGLNHGNATWFTLGIQLLAARKARTMSEEQTNELDAFLEAMGIDTKPETAEEELVSLVFNDESRKGTLSYYLRNEMKLLKAFCSDHSMPPAVRQLGQTELTRFLVGHYLDTYLANHMTPLNAGDVVPDRAKTIQLFIEQPYMVNVIELAWSDACRAPRTIR